MRWSAEAQASRAQAKAGGREKCTEECPFCTGEGREKGTEVTAIEQSEQQHSKPTPRNSTRLHTRQLVQSVTLVARHTRRQSATARRRHPRLSASSPLLSLSLPVDTHVVSSRHPRWQQEAPHSRRGATGSGRSECSRCSGRREGASRASAQGCQASRPAHRVEWHRASERGERCGRAR